MLGEVGHLQEGAGQLLRQTNEPYSLPAASEQASALFFSFLNIKFNLF